MGRVEEMPKENMPPDFPVDLTTGEQLIYHADRLTNEVRDALADGEITVWEGIKIGLSLLGTVLKVIGGRK